MLKSLQECPIVEEFNHCMSQTLPTNSDFFSTSFLTSECEKNWKRMKQAALASVNVCSTEAAGSCVEVDIASCSVSQDKNIINAIRCSKHQP